ncbi:MAG: hypothetical protein U9N60_03030 [Thermodesulfobacteriota bacterium]|nr:hypothetical protein [Thermodesulfobacteriota bacterium]
MTDDKGIFGDIHGRPKARSATPIEFFQVNPGGNDINPSNDPALAEHRSDAFTRGKDLIAEIGVAGSKAG